MHKHNRKPSKPRRVDKGLHIIPLMHPLKGTTDYVKKNGINHIISFEDMYGSNKSALQDIGVKISEFPVNIHQAPQGDGEIKYHYQDGLILPYFKKVTMIPSKSFSSRGRKNLLLGATWADSMIKEGHQVAFSCSWGQRRSTRAHYLYRRIQGDTHKEAMEKSKAPTGDAENLRDTWENRDKYRKI